MTDPASPDVKTGVDRKIGGGKLADWVDTPLEIATAVILSMAALMTSWSSYQAALWDGEQAAHYSEANAGHVASNRESVRAGQLQGADVLMFSQWLNAYAAGEQQLQAFYKARFRPEFAGAVDAWLQTKPLRNPEAPPTPFAMPTYRSAAADRAEALERRASELFAQGQRANEISDAFVQGTVILASAMFFGGMCQAFRSPRVRVALIGVAILACALGLHRILTLPIIRL